MSSKARRRRRAGDRSVVAPSRFFIIAMAVGLLLLGLCVAKVATTPMTATPASSGAPQH